MRGVGGCGVSVNEYSYAHGAQINFGDLTPYLTYDASLSSFNCNIVILLNQCKENALTYRWWRVTKAESLVCECLGRIDFLKKFCPWPIQARQRPVYFQVGKKTSCLVLLVLSLCQGSTETLLSCGLRLTDLTTQQQPQALTLDIPAVTNR
jgi:hypothetical protein